MQPGNRDLQEVEEVVQDQGRAQAEEQAKYSVTLQQMKDMTTKFKAQMRLQQEPMDHLTKIIELLEHVDQDSEAVLGDSEEKRRYFYKDLMGFTQTLAQFIKINLTKPEFLRTVKKLPSLLSSILVKNIENQELLESMRWIFDHKCRLYQHHCLSEENAILIDNSHSQMPEDEREWRESLRVGDQVDAVKIDPEQRVKCWMKAEVQEVLSETKIKVAFPKDTHLCSRELSKFSNEIAKAGSKTEGEEDWREALQLEDKVDCYDSTGYWYASHVIARENKEHQMAVIPMVQIAFRIYHPDGDKTDKSGKKFYGWEDTYDEWFPLHSARLNRYNTHTSENIDYMTEAAQNKNSTTKASAEPSNDFEIVDELDELVSVVGESRIFAVQRAQCRSDLLIDFLNLFGNLGGYEKILAVIQAESQSANDLNLMGSYVDCLGKSAPVLHRKFTEEYIPKLEEAVRGKMLGAQTAQLRVTKKERFDDVIEALYGRLLPRVKNLDQTDLSNSKTIITCEIGKLFLRQNFLERRIDGLKLLSDVSYTCSRILEGGSSAKILTEKQIENAERKNKMVDQILEMICQDGEVLNEIFSKQRTHGQLVQRAEKILNLLMNKEALSESDRKLIWKASEVNDGDMRVELFKVLAGGAQNMTQFDRMYFLGRVSEVSPQDLIGRHIELITEICTTMRGSQKSDEVILKGLELLWAIVMESDNKCPLLIVNRAALGYSDILSRMGIMETIEQTNKLAKTIGAKKMGYVVVKILSRVLKSSFGSPTGHPEIENVSDMVDHLEQGHNLLQLVIEEFQSYMKRVRAEIATGREHLKKDLQGKVIVDLFMHSDQITERIEFIKYYAGRSPRVRLTSGHLNILWDELVSQSVDENDSQLMFKWLREVCDQASSEDKSSPPLIPQEELVKFYEETMNIENKQEEGYRDLSIEGFYCIQSFIVLINMINKKLIKIGEYYGIYKSKHQPAAASTSEPEKQNQTTVKEPTKKKITAIGSDGSTKADAFSFNQSEAGAAGKASASTATGPVYGPQKPSNTTQADERPEDPEELTIKVFTPPVRLDGYNLLWRIATESSSKLVIDAAARILIQMHSKVKYEMQSSVPEFDQMFIDKCLEIIQQQIPEIQQRQKEDEENMFKKYEALPTHASTIQILKCLPLQERRVVRSIFLLRQLVRHSEKWGTYSVKPHSSLKSGKYLPNLQIANNITGDKDGFPKRLEIGIDSNATLWDLKKLLGEKIIVPEKAANTAETRFESQFPSPPVHPATIRVLQMSCQQDLKDPRNGAVLSELKFKTNENLAIYKKRLDLLGCEPIVEDNQENGLPELTFRAKWIIEKIFREYCQAGGKPITQSQAIALINRWNGNHLQKEDARATVFLSQYGDKETKELSLESLQKFILDMAVRGEDLQLRMGLKEMGYAKNLMRLPRDGDPDDICQLRPSKEQMPRYMIANNEVHFDVLMRLLDMHKEVQSRALEMVQSLATCPLLYDRVIKLGGDREEAEGAEFDWGKIFDAGANNVHKMLYSLEIVEAILVRDQEQTTTKDWLSKFMRLQGFEQLQQLLSRALETLGEEELASDKKKYIDQLFQLIRIFVLASSRVEPTTKQSEAERPKEKPSEGKAENEEAYTTPKKQIKRVAERFAASAFDVGEITQEALFGDSDPTPEQEGVAQEGDPAKPKEEEKEKDSLDHLRAALRDTGLAELIIQRADVSRLQDQVIKVVGTFLTAEQITPDDRHIIESAMSLWSTLLQEQEAQDSNLDPKSMLDADFILQGLLYCSAGPIRSTFHATFKKITQSQVALRVPLIEILTEKLRVIEGTDKNVFEFFGLLDGLLREHVATIPQPAEGPVTDMVLSGTFLVAIKLLKEHRSTEKTKASDTDRILRGLLDVIAGVLDSGKKQPFLKPQLLERIVETELVDHILNHCLFRLDSKPTETELAENLTSVQSKCQTSPSRQSAFKLMSAYIEYLEPKEMVEFLETQIKPIIMDVPRPQKWRHLPSSKSRVLQHVGIVNLGCICYMISMLQQLFMVPEFRYQLLKAIDTSPENIQEHKGEKIDDRLLTQLQKLFGFLQLSERHAYNPKELCFSIKDYDGSPIRIGEQKDSQEFVGVFFERLETLLKPTTQRYLLQDTFQGNMCSQFICQSCGKVKNRLELFYTLSLQVKNCTGIADSMSQLIKGQTIEEYQCEGCNKKVDVLKRSLLADMPNVLIVHLQRIVFSFDTFQNDKVNSRFEFPNVLDLKEFSYKYIMKDAEDDEELKRLKEFTDEDYLYRLVGVNIHVGTADHGHYYSIINTKRGSAADQDAPDKWRKVEGDPWREFNDASIKTFNFNAEMKNEAFGGDPEANNSNKNADGMTDADFAAFLSSAGQSYGKSAYMLIYDRKSKKDLREVPAEAPDDAEATQLAFNLVTKGIPTWISDLAEADNKSFMVDAQLFNEDFFEFMKRIYKQVANELLLTSHRYDWAYRQHFQDLKRVSFEVAGKLLFDMLAYYDKNAQLGDVATSFGSLLTFSDAVVYLKQGDPSAIATFADHYFIDDRCAHILETLFTCTDATSRRHIAQVVSRTIQRLFVVYAECDPETRATSESVKHVERTLSSFMDIVLTALRTKECAKSWTRLEAFFQALLDIGKSSLTATQHMLERSDIISDLIDFMLGHKSPRAAAETEKRTTMGGAVPPPFQPLYTLVALLIRLVHTGNMDLAERLPTHGEPKLLEHEGFKTYFLSEEAHIMLTKTDFIEKVIFDSKYTENAEFSKALAHLCYKDLKFTRKVAKKLLKSISYSSNDEVQRHLVVVSEMARVKDEHQEQRLELLFGFAFPMHTKVEDRILQYGAQVTRKNTSEEVFQISSGLDARNHDDALLNLLWKYQGRMDSFTLTCLEFLGDLLAADEAIAEYFSNLAAPNYTMARYTDWMIPYLKKQLEETKKFPGTGTEEKATRIKKVQGVLAKYEGFLAAKKADFVTYVIHEAVEEEVVKVEDIDDTLELIVTKIGCKWSESRPQGHGQQIIDAGNPKTSDQKDLDPLGKQGTINASTEGGEANGDVELQALDDAEHETDTDAASNKFEQQIGEPQAAEHAQDAPLSTLAVSGETYCPDLLYRLTLKNKHAKAVQVKLSFDPVKPGEPINLAWPRSGVKDFIRSGYTSHVLTLRKVAATTLAEASAEIDKLSIQVKWKAHDENDFEMGQFASQTDRPGKDQQPAQSTQGTTAGPEIRDKRRNGLLIDLVPTETGEANAGGDRHEMATSPMAGTGNAGEFVKADIADMPDEMAGTRACPVCTLLNDAEAVVCDCCGSVLG